MVSSGGLDCSIANVYILEYAMLTYINRLRALECNDREGLISLKKDLLIFRGDVLKQLGVKKNVKAWNTLPLPPCTEDLWSMKIYVSRPKYMCWFVCCASASTRFAVEISQGPEGSRYT